MTKAIAVPLACEHPDNHKRPRDQPVDFLPTFVKAALIIALWILPGLIANNRNHPRRISIWYLTELLGLCGVGWIIVMVWPCRTPKPKAARPIAEGLKLVDESFR